MRPRNESARDRLRAAMARRPAAAAAELAGELGVSVATLHRLLSEQGRSVVTAGRARRARYAWRRELRGDASDIPLYAVDIAGVARPMARLALVHPQGSHLDLADTAWPVPEDSRDGWWGGLPYPLYDMRPQGYLGRQFARAEHRRFGVSPDPDAWSDDDIVHVLAQAGSDTSGNLILGNAAFEAWQGTKVAATTEPLSARGLGAAYARLAEQAVGAAVHGSSAAGEFPKFAALREAPGSATPHVLVKFSGADGSSAVQRWADLLVCEHLALECARELPGVASAASRIVQHGGRTFLEVERFDRHGLHGRSALASLSTLDAALIGAGSSDWTLLARRLHAQHLLGAEDGLRIEHLWWFGRLIANSDMHTGNLSFRPEVIAAAPAAPAARATARVGPVLVLAPAYDMQPMLYAPLPGGEVPQRRWQPLLPLPPERHVWLAAARAAVSLWRRCARDRRISEGFRAVCAANAALLDGVAARV